MVTTANSLFKTKAGLTECRWLAVNNPNYVTLVRQDYQVSIIITTTLPNTNVLVNTTGVTQAQFELDFTVGKQVYLSAINQSVTITSRTYIGANSIFSFNSTISYTTGGGYANCLSRSDYFIEVKYVLFSDTVSPFPTKSEKVIPFNNGTLDLNISPALVTFLTLKTDGEDLSVVNIRDTNASRIVGINYKEYYQGSYKGETQLINGSFYIVNNYKNAFEQYGSCLADYEMEVLSNNKFLTRMVKPYYWSGYPFALGFLYSLKIADKNVYRLEIEQDINEQTINTTDTALIVSTPAQNYEYLNSLTLRGGYTGNSVLVRLVSEATSGVMIIGYARDYANNYFNNLVIPPILIPQIVSEFKRVYIGKCIDSPVYLRWRNSLGYFDFWLFGKRQVKNIQVDKFDTFEPLITDIEFQQESEAVQSKDKNKAWRIGAYLEMQSVTDIQELFSSPFVQWYNEENQKWYTVKVKQGTYLESVTDENYAEIEFDIEFPKDYKQEQ
jgi:hypothetical protein